MKKLNILVLCHDVIGINMAGPGIRYKYIADTLGKKHSVTLAIFSTETTRTNGVIAISPESTTFKIYFDQNDIIFAQWLSNDMVAYARATGKILIFDLYAPVPIEYLASIEFSSKPPGSQQEDEFNVILDMYNNYLSVGQLFTCSNERQRDFWTGYTTANHQLTPATFTKSNPVQKFVLCPMGVDKTPPQPAELLLRKSLEGIQADDFILLWSGGIWDWFDAQIIVQAMALVKDSHIKLVFLGTRHPNTIYKDETYETKATRVLAGRLGLVDRTVFFMDGWVPYEDRAAYFMDADAAIYADKESLETRFSHRTRVLDHIWCDLPTICSNGDYLSTIIEKYSLGTVVKERDPRAFADAILELSNNASLYKKIKANAKHYRSEIVWKKTLQPLVDFVDTVDVPKLKQQIKLSAIVQQPATKLPLKRRLRLSAKMLLLGR